MPPEEMEEAFEYAKKSEHLRYECTMEPCITLRHFVAKEYQCLAIFSTTEKSFEKILVTLKDGKEEVTATRGIVHSSGRTCIFGLRDLLAEMPNVLHRLEDAPPETYQGRLGRQFGPVLRAYFIPN